MNVGATQVIAPTSMTWQPCIVPSAFCVPPAHHRLAFQTYPQTGWQIFGISAVCRDAFCACDGRLVTQPMLLDLIIIVILSSKSSSNGRRCNALSVSHFSLFIFIKATTALSGSNELLEQRLPLHVLRCRYHPALHLPLPRAQLQ